MVDNSQLLKTGTVLHNTYRIDSYLASGGFGNTYLVTHLQLNEHMVVKEFFLKGVNLRGEDTTTVRVGVTENNPLFKSQREKFKKEAQRIRKLNNDHVVKVHDLFEENDTVYYVMDYIEGSSLKSLMQQLGGAFSENVVEKVLLEILDALDAVHGANLWHMDIKPDNIMIDKTGRCVLIDFGSSKQMTVEETNQTSTAMTYTPGYAPMEQVDGSKDSWGPWTDFYALGATLYNLLTNNRPPMSSDISVKGDNAFSYPYPVSDQIRQVISQMMQPIFTARPKDSTTIRQILSNPVSQTGILTNNEKTVFDKPVITQPKPELTSKNNENTFVYKPVVSKPQPKLTSENMMTKEKTKKGNRKFWIIIGILAAIIVGLVIGLIAAIKHSNFYEDLYKDINEDYYNLQQKLQEAEEALEEPAKPADEAY